jgi:hypothetical protein
MSRQADGNLRRYFPGLCWLPVIGCTEIGQLVDNLVISGSLFENYVEWISAVATTGGEDQYAQVGDDFQQEG